MIHQALADAFQSNQDGNAHVPEVTDWADAGAQQMRRRMDSAAGENDLTAAEFLLPPVDLRLYTDALRAFKQQFSDLRVGGDREVSALARFAIEIAHRGRDALLGLIGVRHREIAVDELTVLVGDELMAGLVECLGEGLRMPCPVLPWNSANRDSTIFAMEGAVEIEVALDLLEKGQH